MPAPTCPGSIVTGPATTRVELRHHTWDATVTNAPPIHLPATTPGRPDRSFEPDIISVTYLQIHDPANRATSHGWRVHEIEITGPWLPNPRTGHLTEPTKRGTIRIQGLRAAPDWAQAHAVANAPTATLLDAAHDPLASGSDGFVARTGIGLGAATDHDLTPDVPGAEQRTVHVTAPRCYTEAIHTVTIPDIRGADPLPTGDTTELDPRILTITFAWRTQTSDTDWSLDQLTVNGTVHTTPPTNTPGPTVLLGRTDAPEWTLALATTKTPDTVLRFGSDPGLY